MGKKKADKALIPGKSTVVKGASRQEVLVALGISSQAISPQVWESIAGMENERRLIETKILLPLLHSELAQKHGVVPPKAILLFGPPGTGKTLFARGIAGRLGWSFVEVGISELMAEGASRQALLLREVFRHLQGVEKAVIFFDEFEALALRPERAGPRERILASEMLKQMPRFRASQEVLLICATNNIEHLTPALLRPGRFDYILPMGPMDVAAREEVFLHYLKRLHQGEMDLSLVAARAEYYTPADIEAVCATVAQLAFEEELATGQDRRVTTQDLLMAVDGHRPTLSREDLERFRADIQRYCRTDYCRVLTV